MSCSRRCSRRHFCSALRRGSSSSCNWARFSSSSSWSRKFPLPYRPKGGGDGLGIGTVVLRALPAVRPVRICVNVINGEYLMYYWATTCLTPLLLLFAADRLVADVSDAMRVVRAALAAILIFAAVVWLAQMTGHSHLLAQYGVAWRFADARAISMGPLKFEVWSIRLGSLAALGMPAALVLAVAARSYSGRCLYVAVMICPSPCSGSPPRGAPSSAPCAAPSGGIHLTPLHPCASPGGSGRAGAAPGARGTVPPAFLPAGGIAGIAALGEI